MKRRQSKLLRFLMRLCVAVLLTVCLCSALTPTALVASAFGVNTGMVCCSGSGAGHCKLALKAKPPEPMCGLKQQRSEDAITVVADAYESQVGTTISVAMFTYSCHGECSTCAVASPKLTKRQKAAPVTQFTNPTVLACAFEEAPTSDLPSLIAVELVAPRGPPIG